MTVNNRKSLFHFFAALALSSTSLFAQQSADPAWHDPSVMIHSLKIESAKELKTNLLPFWTQKMTDYNQGGFYGRIDADNKVYPDDDKGGILNARILWTYSSAYRIYGDTSYLKTANRAKEYILKYFIDKKYGGAYRSLKADGSPSDTRKQTYTESFFIYALAEYYRATGDKEALEAAKSVFEVLEKYAIDPLKGGYFEVFSRDWKRTHDLLIGESDVTQEKTMNTHLHLMEAYSNLYRVWPDQKVKKSLLSLIEIFNKFIIDPSSNHLICFLKGDWKSASSIDSYGHDIEASWLLCEAASLTYDSALIRLIKQKALKIAVAAREGIQPDGSMIYESERGTGKSNRERSWWVQAEAVTGFINAYQITSDEENLRIAVRCWDYIKKHFIDRNGGGWYSAVLEDGTPGRGDKGGFWVCPYHNGRMCMELTERISDLRVWYDRPAGNTWEAALPVGNGRIGGMIYGNPVNETVRLNESTVWTGGPNRNDNPDALAALPEVRKLIFEGKFKEASALASQKIESKKNFGMMYQPVGDLRLTFTGIDSSTVTDYYRELDLEKAVVKTSFSSNSVHYTREVFSSFPDQVLVIHLKADEKGKLNFIADALCPHKKSEITVNADNQIIINAITGDHEGVSGAVRFNTIIQIDRKGGSSGTEGKRIIVKDADEATVIVSIATNYKKYNDISGNEKQLAADYLKKAMKPDYNTLLSNHINYYSRLFSRVSIDLGTTDSVDYPTDRRLAHFAAGKDPQFVSLYYQFNRYLLISASQPGGQPATLQGLWNHDIEPAWDSKYTININTEMNYWPSEPANLSEMSEPLIQLVRDLSVTGKETARVMYGAGGWLAHHNTDLWRITGPVDAIEYGMWPMGGAWLSQQLWEKYMFGGDKKYLLSVYPVLKEASHFFSDFLIKEPVHGWLVVSPSMSPENIPGLPGLKNTASIAAGVTMDNQILFDLFSNTIHAAELLDTDKEFAARLKVLRSKLPPMQIGRLGQLQEWMQDIDNPEDQHRHVSHLFGLHPGKQISPYSTPELFDAARTSLKYRGDGGTGWSMAWKVNFWARFQDGNHALTMIKNQLSPAGLKGRPATGGTFTNLFDAHPPFQIDGNFGCLAGITEMLLQSHDEAVAILPALPDEWSDGRINGLRARGGFEILDLEWKNGHLRKLVIKSNLGGNCRLRVRDQIVTRDGRTPPLATGNNTNDFFRKDIPAKPIISPEAKFQKPVLYNTYLYDINTVKDGVYTFEGKGL